VTRMADGEARRYFGVYPALVTDIVDSDSLGRVEVRFPWLGTPGSSDVRTWATLVTPYADDDQGIEILPSVGTQVVVAFEAGDLRRPYVIGASWNGVEALPESAASENNLRLWKSRAKSKLEFDDTAGAAKVSIVMQSGHKVVLDDGAQEVTVTHSNGCFVKIDAAGRVVIQANASCDITAPVLNVHAATANFDGIINCTTLIASSGVVSPSYTPGAGNIW
jgi:uncharacterized protein involved in type VI secretion and phage assembly